MESAMFTIGVFAVIINEENRVLLSHRKDFDLWNLPGGGMISGEAPWDGVIREVREETGLEVEVVKLSGIYSKPLTDEVVLNFICKISGGKLITTEEADAHKFFSLQELPDNTVSKQVERIRDALSAQPEVQLKAQFGPSSTKI
jgi:ADP-ribose pyrophosphatase YjhB (NUDIX family)